MRFLTILFIGLFFISCTKDSVENENFQETIYSKSNDSTTPFPDVLKKTDSLRQSMASFVQGVDQYYEKGMTYVEFKNALDPDNGLSNMKKEGNELLNQAYTYLDQDTKEKDMDGEIMLIAFASAIDYNEAISSKDFNNISNEDYEIVFKELFGLPSDYEIPSSAKGGCPWYRVDCHVGWLIGTIAKWWNTPAPGDGGMTNGGVVSAIVAVCLAIIAATSDSD